MPVNGIMTDAYALRTDMWPAAACL